MKYLVSLIGFVTVLLVGSTAFGQALSYDLGGGHTFRCNDSEETPVRFYDDPTLGDVGAAWANRDRMGGFHPYIKFNPHILRQIPLKIRMFWFAHECSHHAVGHVREKFETGRSSLTREEEADCHAVKMLRDDFNFTKEDFRSIASTLVNNPSTGRGHLPGPMRAKKIMECSEIPSEKEGEEEKKSDDADDDEEKKDEDKGWYEHIY